MRSRAPAFLAGAAAATSLVSIAASQILLGLAILALAVNRSQWRWPPVSLPLLLFLGWTLLAVAASPDPAGGLPQVKKFYVYAMLFVVFSGLRTLAEVRWLALAWTAGAALSALWGLGQYGYKFLTTPRLFYFVYSNERITGFQDHWMTFSGLQMMALLLAGAMLLFWRDRGWMPWRAAATAVIALALLIGYTRSMWMGAAAGALWLLWWKKKWLAALVPLIAALLLLLNPFQVRDRAMAVFQPQTGVLRVTEHRAALRATGWEMIKAHPLTGIGPEQAGKQFLAYAPPSVPRPIPADWYYQHLHNVYYQYAAERGLPALAALLWFLLRALLDFWRGLRQLPPDSEARWMLHGAIASILAVMVSGYAEVNLGDSEVLGMFLAVVACGYIALASESQPARR
jgi:O-antigen ligase